MTRQPRTPAEIVEITAEHELAAPGLTVVMFGSAIERGDWYDIDLWLEGPSTSVEPLLRALNGSDARFDAFVAPGIAEETPLDTATRWHANRGHLICGTAPSSPDFSWRDVVEAYQESWRVCAHELATEAQLAAAIESPLMASHAESAARAFLRSLTASPPEWQSLNKASSRKVGRAMLELDPGLHRWRRRHRWDDRDFVDNLAAVIKLSG